MGRCERFTTEREIKQSFLRSDETKDAGVNIFHDGSGTYCDTSEKHALFLGRTGCGKSTCCSIPLVRNVIDKGENAIVCDPKGEIWNKLGRHAQKEGYRVFCFDFRRPSTSPVKVNLLRYICDLYESGDIDDMDQARNMLGTLVDSLKMEDKDPFWCESGGALIEGLVLALIELGHHEEVHFASVVKMMDDLGKKCGIKTYAQSFVDVLPADSPAQSHIQTYVQAPNDTRNSIYAVAKTMLKVFNRSEGLLNMISTDDLVISQLDMNEKFIFFIIIPDNTDVFDGAAGVLISQLTHHYLSLADRKYFGRLPKRLTVVLEELGNIASCIPLAHLATASRSRNLRLAMVLQNEKQLAKLYGESDAETILSSVGVMIGFSSHSFEMLHSWELRLGEKTITHGGQVIREPLITAAQLGAMQDCQALVMVGGRYKFITKFPYYDELYDTSDWEPPLVEAGAAIGTLQLFDLVEISNEHHERKRNEFFRGGNPFAAPSARESAPSSRQSAPNPDKKRPDRDMLFPKDDDESDAEIEAFIARVAKEVEKLDFTGEEDDGNAG